MLFIIILVDWFTLIFLRKGHQRSCVFVCFFLYSNLIPFCCGLCHWVDCWVFIVYRLFSLCCDYFASSRLKSVDSSNVFHFFKFFSLFCLIFFHNENDLVPVWHSRNYSVFTFFFVQEVCTAFSFLSPFLCICIQMREAISNELSM